MNGLAAVLMLAQAASSAKVIDFGVGTLSVPDGCTHVPGRGVDSTVGAFACGTGPSRIAYDISSRGAASSERGWCTAVSKDSEFPPARVTELRTQDGRKLFLCDLPQFQDEPARLVAVLSPYASFYVRAKTPADATWLLTIAQAFRARR